jgi:hypothetical protein
MARTKKAEIIQSSVVSNEPVIPVDSGIVRQPGVKKSTVSIYELRQAVIEAIKYYKDKKTGEIVGINGIIERATPNEILKFLGKILPKNIEIEKNEKRIIINLNHNVKDI